MRLISQLVRSLLTLLLIAIFGMGGAGAAPRDWTQVSYPVVAQELSAQSVDLTNTARAPERLPGQSDDDYAAVYNAWKNDVAGQANLLGAVVGYTTSGGQAVNVSNAASIAQSGALNNFLSHLEMVEKVAAEEALAACEALGNCSDEEMRGLQAEILQWTILDEARDLEIQQFCAEGNALGCIGIYNELGEILAEDLAFYNTLDPDSALARAIFAEGVGNDQLRNRLLALGGQAGARNTQITMNGIGFGAAGGVGAAVITFGGPAALRCAADYTCRTNLALGIAEELAMTPGAFTGAIVVTGSTVKLADQVIGTLDDVNGFVRAPNRTALIDDLQASGAKITPENVVDIQKLPDGQTVWLETGNNSAGLQHINRHADEFAQKGISQDQIPDAVFSALQQNNVVGYQGAGTGRPIYEYTFNGQTHRMAVTVGDNGFIVGANPTSLP